MKLTCLSRPCEKLLLFSEYNLRDIIKSESSSSLALITDNWVSQWYLSIKNVNTEDCKHWRLHMPSQSYACTQAQATYRNPHFYLSGVFSINKTVKAKLETKAHNWLLQYKKISEQKFSNFSLIQLYCKVHKQNCSRATKSRDLIFYSNYFQI